MWGLEPIELKRLILSVGTHRGARPLGPVEVGRIFKKMIDNGASRADCADVVHLTGASMIGKFLRLLKLRDELEPTVDWEPTSLIGFTSASEIAGLPRDEQSFVAQATLENGLISREVRQIMELKRNSGSNITDCIEQIIALRPTVEKRYVFLGRIDDQEITSILQGMDRNLRNEIFDSVLVGLIKDDKETEGRLSAGRFSIICGEQAADELNRLVPDFESVIIESLERQVSQGV